MSGRDRDSAMKLFEEEIEEPLRSVIISEEGGIDYELYSDECHKAFQTYQRICGGLEATEKLLQENIRKHKEKLSLLEKDRNASKKELLKIKEEMDTLSIKISKLKREEDSLNYNIAKLEAQKETTPKDKELMRKHHIELQAYRKISGIQWKHDAPTHLVSGILSNTSTNSVKVFEFDKSSQSSQQIRLQLWELMKTVSKEHENGEANQ